MNQQGADQVIPYPKSRHFMEEAIRSTHHKPMMHGLLEVDVTKARAWGFGGVGDKAHGHKHPTADGDGHGQRLLAGPPDDRNQAGRERDEGAGQLE